MGDFVDSATCNVVKTLPASKLCDFEMFWERFHSRQKPVTRGVYSSLGWSNTENILEPLHLEPKTLIVSYLGQPEKAPKGEISEAADDLIHETPLHSSQENEKLSPKHTKHPKRENTLLHKHLRRARQHIIAVKQGRDYFHLLQKEEQEVREERRRERQRRGKLRRTELRLPVDSTDSDDDSDNESLIRWRYTDSSSETCNRRKRRPFTPVHRSLASAEPHQLTGECVYRQLCCLNWLLEALTAERSGRIGPVTSCWDVRDPGRSRNTIKRLNKERAIEAKWEQFIATPKPSRPLTARPFRVSSGRPLTWKSSALSAVSSLLTASSTGSLSSLAAAAEHLSDDPVLGEGETLSVRELLTDPPPTECRSPSQLTISDSQKLFPEVHQRPDVFRPGSERKLTLVPDSNTSVKVQPEMEQNTANEKTASIKSFPVRNSSETFHEKKVMLDEIKATFDAITEELTLSLSDALDRIAKKRWDFGVQRYRSLCYLASRGRIRSAVSCLTSAVSTATVQDSKVTNAGTAKDPYSTQWLSELLSSLTPIKQSDRRIACLLEKLSRFTEGLTLRVHPHSFFRVLNSLASWELCCPDLCVAIEIVRKNIVKMPKAEYDSWLLRKINQSQTSKTATHNM